MTEVTFSFNRRELVSEATPQEDIPLLSISHPTLEYNLVKEKRSIGRFDEVHAFMGFLTFTNLKETPLKSKDSSPDVYNSILVPSLHTLRKTNRVLDQRRYRLNERNRQRQACKWFPTTEHYIAGIENEQWRASTNNISCSFRANDVAYRTMFMYHIPKTISESRLRAEILQNTQLQSEAIQRIVIVRDCLSGRTQGYSFVIFAKRVYMSEAMKLLKRMQLEGKRVGLDVRRGGVELVKYSEDIIVWRKIPQRLMSTAERDYADRHPSRKRPWPSPP